MNERDLFRKAEWLWERGYFPDKSVFEIVEFLREKQENINRGVDRGAPTPTDSNAKQ